MRVVNRTAVTIAGAEPFLAWTRTRDADFNKGTLTVARTRAESAAFLLPEVEFRRIRVAVRPRSRDVPRVVRVDVHGTVVDVPDDEIEGEEL